MSVRESLHGTWDWADVPARCGNDAGTYAFAADGRTLTVEVPAGAYFDTTAAGSRLTYEILAEPAGGLRVRAVGETRRTATGAPVEWEIVMLDQDTFCWHRTDWQAGGCTKPLARCKGE